MATIDVLPDRRAEYTAEIDRLHDDLVWTHPGVTTYDRTSGDADLRDCRLTSP